MPTAPSEPTEHSTLAATTGAGWRTSAARLFPPVAPVRVRATHVAMAIVATVVGTVAVLGRQSGAGALDTIYAEDGDIFLQQAYDHGLAATLLEPYAGYGHVVPRLLLAPIAALPVGSASAGLATTAAALTALLAVAAYWSLRGHVRSVPLRAMAAASFVLIPVGQEEVFNVVANLHWFLIPISALLLLFDPESRWETAVACAIVAATAASDPMAVGLVPLAAVRLLSAVPPRARLVPMALGFGLLVQAVVVAGGSDSRGTELEPSTNPVKLALWWVFDVPARTVAGSRWVDDIDAITSWVVALAAIAALVGLALLARRRLNAIDVLVPFALVVSGGLLYLAYAGVSGARPPRYGVPASILLVVAIAVILDKLLARLDRRSAQRLVAVAGAVTLVVWAVNYRVDTRRSVGPRWSDEVESARSRCDGPGDREQLTLAPEPSWEIEIGCDALG